MAQTAYVPTNSIVLWPASAASIPLGFTRDTDWDDRFLQGSSTAGTNGGGAHTHTLSHTHTGNSHGHSISAGTSTADYPVPRSTDPEDSANRGGVSHGHNSVASNPATITYQNTAASTNSADGKPPFLRTIILKATGSTSHIPSSGLCFTDETTAPSGFHVTDGDGGTTDYDGLFILGALSAGDGGAISSTATHTHTDPGHSHVCDSHLHTNKTLGNSNSIAYVKATPVADTMLRAHHQGSLDAEVLSDTNTTVSVIDNSTYAPAYTYLLGILNTGDAATPVGVVLPFEGESGDVPDNWAILDGGDGRTDMTASQPRITKTGGTVKSTGGDNNHTHGSTTSHTHTHASSHNHTITFGDTLDSPLGEIASGVYVPDPSKGHVHPWTVASVTPTLQNNTFTTGSSDGRYNYRTCLFIRKISEPTEEEKQPAVFFGCNF